MKLILPYPVSANRYWRSFVPKGWTRAVVHPSDEAKAYKREVGWLAKAAGFRAPTTKPIALSLTLIAPAFRMAKHPTTGVPREVENGIVMDLGNCLKVAEDALQGIVYENDRQVRAITLAYDEPDGKGALIVEVTEFEQPEQQAIPLPEPALAEESELF